MNQPHAKGRFFVIINSSADVRLIASHLFHGVRQFARLREYWNEGMAKLILSLNSARTEALTPPKLHPNLFVAALTDKTVASHFGSLLKHFWKKFFLKICVFLWAWRKPFQRHFLEHCQLQLMVNSYRRWLYIWVGYHDTLLCNAK